MAISRSKVEPINTAGVWATRVAGILRVATISDVFGSDVWCF